MRIALFAVPVLLLTTAAQQPKLPPAAPVAAPTIPTRVTAKMLSDLCAQERGACLGYVVGSTDSWAGALAAAGRPQVVCIPASVNNDQVTQAIVRYIRAHPEDGGLNASVVIFAGLRASFPCGY